MNRICEYKHCDVEFEAKRSHGRFCSDRCRTLDWKENDSEEAGERVPERSLSDIAAEQETRKANQSYGLLIRTAIVDQLKTKGTLHADDLSPLYPAGEVQRCRNLATAQFGSMARLKLIEKVEWRKSSEPSRNGAGSWVWRLTQKGRVTLVGSTTDVAPQEGDEPNRALARLSSRSDEAVSGAVCVPGESPGASGANPETDTASSGSLFDESVGARGSRSAFTDAEAA